MAPINHDGRDEQDADGQELPLRTGPDAAEIQGNILAGFLKDHQVFLFVRFPSADGGRAWLSDLVKPEEDPDLSRIATTKQVAAFNREFSEARRKRGGDDPEAMKAKWINVALTAPGLLLLDPTVEADLGTIDGVDVFRAGAQAAADRLRDAGPQSGPEHWVFGHDEASIHALLTVAADDPDHLDVEMAKLRAACSTADVTIVYEQRGDTLHAHRRGHEHFGFKDGISQPGVVGFDETDPDTDELAGHPGSEMIAAGEFVLGHPRAGDDDEPRHHAAWMRNGSFQVFRRLAQDVPGWWAQVTNRASEPQDDPMLADLLGAKLIGRWRSGTPLALRPERDNRSSRAAAGDNDFDYDDDKEGLKTPRFSHIRKMYPRDDATFGDDRRRILRRGIPFGKTFDPSAGRGHGADADRGLLFNAFMTSIRDQFEFLQSTWANDANFPGNAIGDNVADGPDPVIGDDPASCRIRRPGRPDVELDFRRFVHTTGAVYLFAPSMTTLHALATGTPIGEGAAAGGGDAPDPAW